MKRGRGRTVEDVILSSSTRGGARLRIPAEVRRRATTAGGTARAAARSLRRTRAPEEVDLQEWIEINAAAAADDFAGQFSRSASAAQLRPLTGLSPPATRQSLGPADWGALQQQQYAQPASSAAAPLSYLDQDPSARAPHATAADDMIAALSEKCRTLTERLAQVEAELHHAGGGDGHDGDGDGAADDATAGTAGTAGTGAAGGGAANKRSVTPAARRRAATLEAARPGVDAARSAAAAASKAERDSAAAEALFFAARQTVGALHNVFNVTEQEDEKRKRGADLINACARKLITRRKYRAFKKAYKTWERHEARETLEVLAYEAERQGRVDVSLRRMETLREMRLVTDLFAEWAGVMYANQAVNKQIKKHALAMEGAQNGRWLERVFRGWSGVVKGPSSRKACRLRHQGRLEEARRRLEDARKAAGEWPSLISPEEVALDVTRHLTEIFYAQQRWHALNVHFSAVRRLRENALANRLEAERHHRLSELRKVFFPWTEWAWQHSQGLDRKRWKGPRRYEVAYNQRRVDIFARKRVLRLAFPLWRAVTTREAAVSRKFRACVTRLGRIHFDAWRAQATVQHALRARTVVKWKDVGLRRVALPFRAWFMYVDKRRQQKLEMDRVVRSHMRLKRRQILWKILRSWRHLAVFGRIEGLYTRTELMRTLAEQKSHCALLELQAEEHAALLEEMETMLNEEHDTLDAHKLLLEKREEEAGSQRMALHNAEAELARLNDVVDCVASVQPAVTKYIVRHQQGWGFRDRGLAELAKIRQEQAGDESAAGGQPAEGSADDLLSGTDAADGGAALKALNLAAASGAPLSEHEATALLVRLSFVLGAADFRNVTAVAGKELAEAKRRARDDQNPLVKAKNNELQALYEDLAGLHGLWEFMRTGDAKTLPTAHAKPWTRFVEERAERLEDDPDAGSGRTKTWGPSSALLQRATVSGRAPTWHDFVNHVTARLPAGRELGSVRNAMARRIVDSNNRQEATLVGLYAAKEDRDENAVNLYAANVEPIDDAFEPDGGEAFAY